MRTQRGHAIRALGVLLVSVFSMLWAAQLLAADCSPDDIELSSQADVDDFQANHGPCDRVVGLLTIDGADIENMDGLSALTSIGDGLRFLFTSSLDDISGLSLLSSIDGYLFFTDCESLTQIDGLSNLLTVGGSVHFQFNDALVNLNGLSTLTSAGSIILEGNYALTDLDGLSSLTDVELNVHLESNSALTSLQGLAALTSVGGNLTIRGIVGLVDLEGLHNIPSLGGDLLLSYNSGLLSVDLENLATVNGNVSIQNNASLTQLDGLSNLIGVGENLLVSENPRLGECASLTKLLDDVDDGQPGPGPGLDGIPDVGNQATFLDNQEGCNSISEIMTIFGDGFESQQITNIVDDPVNSVGFESSIVVGTDNFPVISYWDENANMLKVAKCNDTACSGNDETVTSVTSGGRQTSIAISQDGFPVISHRKIGLLMVTKCNDVACAGGDELTTQVDDSLGTPRCTSLAISQDGYPVIAYGNGEDNVLQVAKCDDVACTGGGESLSVVYDPDESAGFSCSLAIGHDGDPVVSSIIAHVTLSSLVVTKCNDAACAGSDETTTTLDGPNPISQTSIAIGTDNNPVISYRVAGYNQLKMAHCNDAACTGNDELVSIVDDVDDVGEYNSIVIGDDGFPVISYFDRTAGALKVAKCNDEACTGGNETITTVDDPPTSAGFHTSITIGDDGRPVISYWQYDAGGAKLKVTRCGNPSCDD